MPTNQQTESPPAAPRVVLVDCFANQRLFIRDSSFRALETDLRAAGFAVELLELVRDDAPADKSAAALARRLSDEPPALVVVSRAWGGDLPADLRAATGGTSRIVRFSHGAPSAIDELFDAVLDARGIRDLLGGSDAPAAPHWRRSKREMAAAEPIAADFDAGRPTISGPARGCPFLVDVRTSPAYRTVDIDFDSVQTKGCSFCLDNVGAFAAFPDEEVVAAWLQQLRVIRGARPDVREILLTDERPHPLLPALFRAVLDEPALHGIELLIKSRVDWLAEYADGALGEACELAARSGSVLHLYLVGFESFHQSDLDLFNKAVDVADNVRAVALLRELERRHPESFEFRRHRAHGIVLFHPWTTPESLLDNARAMREVGFHELRSQALRTRLRLYASVPLHALAERQGLLVESFAEGRGDRAVEQGYDASIPWRFADSRVESIYRAANRIADARPELAEADVLEMVTRFVLRHPEVAAEPDAVAPPILQALFTWGTSPAEVVAVAGPTLAGFDREVEAVAAAEKAACLKEGVPHGEAEDLMRAYAAMGLAARVVSAHERGGDDGRHRRGDSHVIVAVARDATALEVVVANQLAVERSELVHIPTMGVLMGYPPCCVAAFAGQRAHGDNLDLERAPFRAAPDHPLAWPINRFGAVSLMSHMLCAPDCAASVSLAESRLATLARLDADAAQRIAADLKSAVLRLDYRRAARLAGAWRGERYVVESLRPFAGCDLGVDPADVRGVRLDGGGVTLDTTRGERRLESPGAMLVEPGAPLSPCVPTATPASREALGPVRDQPAIHRYVTSADPLLGKEGAFGLLAAGTAVGDYTIERTESDRDDGLLVVLGRGANRIGVRVRRWIPSRPSLSRRGPWALDLDGEPGEANEEARRLVGALARLLPAGSHGPDPAPAPATPPPAPAAARRAPRADVDEVVCTAPWTTLEVVDPDGLARQCCADWTAGDRGNLREQTLVEVWNGPGYRMARRVMSGRDLSSLCHSICPRLYDGKFAERELTINPGAEPFVRNQQLLLEDIAERRETVRANPLYIAVCPSTYCNYDCIMCLHGRTPRRDLPESIWDELLEMLPTLRVLTLLGGEPLANPAAMRFLRTWDRRLYPDAAVGIVTNGSLLGPKALAHLERCNFGNVTVSLNAGTAEVYERVQRGVALDEVLGNLDALIDLRRRQGTHFPIVLSFVVQPANHTTLIPFAELARLRDLPIRLMPLSPEGVEELDFYGDADQVAKVLESLDEMAAWAEQAAPQYLQEIRGTRGAIAARGGAGKT